MDVRYFLVQRLEFVSQLYSNSAKPFVEKMRLIEAEEEPSSPPYSEDSEPTFLVEWLEAEASLQVLGQACVSMLSASFHLYFKTLIRQFSSAAETNYKPDFKKGWLNGYKAYFRGEFDIAFEDSQCDLSMLEELTLARNRVQHPECITSHTTHYLENDLNKLSSPFFINPQDEKLFNQEEKGQRSWLMHPTIHITEEKFLHAVSEVAHFAEWLEKIEPRPRRNGCLIIPSNGLPSAAAHVKC